VACPSCLEFAIAYRSAHEKYFDAYSACNQTVAEHQQDEWRVLQQSEQDAWSELQAARLAREEHLAVCATE
jgi:hypothetical protein